MTLSNNIFARRKDLEFEDLRRASGIELMKNFKKWKFNNEEFLQILKGFVKDGLGNPSFIFIHLSLSSQYKLL